MIQIQEITSRRDLAELEQIASNIWEENLNENFQKPKTEHLFHEYLTQESAAKKIEQGYKYYFVVNHSEEVIGYIVTYYYEPTNSFFLANLGIYKALRGYAYAKRIMDKVKESAVQQGCNKIYCDVSTEAQSLAEMLGFTPAVNPPFENRFKTMTLMEQDV